MVETTSSAAAESPKKGITRQRINVSMVQNVLLVWLDSSIDEENEDCQSKITQLQRVINSITTFADRDQCVDFLTDIHNGKVSMIVSGTLCQNIVPLIHDVAQLHAVFIHCKHKTRYEQWAKHWSKVKGVFTEISAICETLKLTIQQCEQNAIPISFVNTSGDNISKKKLDKLDPSFMYTQILKEIFLTIEFNQENMKQFLDYCRDLFADNNHTLNTITKFEQTYHNETPIRWYTSELFLYSTLNFALRTMNVDIIIKMGFFINDLHRHLEHLHNEQFNKYSAGSTFTVYRGQGISTTDFDEVMKTKGGLLSFNNFLSTSKNRDISLLFAESNESNPDVVGILFVMSIDLSQSTTPCASINSISHFKEEDEVLFSMHTVFRIGDIQSMSEHHRLFQVNLTLSSDNDKDLRVLTDYIREETLPHEEGWSRLCTVLYKMGQFDKAQQISAVMLGQKTNEYDKGYIYNRLGALKWSQGEYKEAMEFYEKCIEIEKRTLPPNHPRLAGSYSNIGNVYKDMGDNSKALSSQEKALAIHQQSLPPNHPDLAGSYNNVGNVYFDMGNNSKALSSFEKALAIRQQSLPPNHPDMASSYNNIGAVYSNMGNNSKALSSYEKALALRQLSLPPNHPHLASSYNNIGIVYRNMSDNSKALSSYEKALSIHQQSLPPNHPHLAGSYNNIGNVYSDIGDNSKALSSYEKALSIQQQSLPPNHPDLASSYNNIGRVYYRMGDNSKARLFLERAVNIGQHSLPSNHPRLQLFIGNLDRLNELVTVTYFPRK